MAAMTPVERIEAAIRLEKPDRVPVVPMIDCFSARYGGITQEEMFFDIRKADMALHRTLEDLGSVDGLHQSYAGLGKALLAIFPVPPLIPGVGDIPPDGQFQFVEKSIMEREEYGRMGERGVLRWLLDKLKLYHPWLGTPTGFIKGLAQTGVDSIKVKLSVRAWRRRGVDSMVASNLTFSPMEGISMLLRPFNDFMLDPFYCPEVLKVASRELIKPLKSQPGRHLGYLQG
jgi:hypothetical protein